MQERGEAVALVVLVIAAHMRGGVVDHPGIGGDDKDEFGLGLLHAVDKPFFLSRSENEQSGVGADKAPVFNDPEINRAFVYAPLGIETEEELLGLWEAIDRGELLTKGFNCCFPSIHDPEQAPPGRCVATIHRMAPYNLKDGVEKYYKYSFRLDFLKPCARADIPYFRDIHKPNLK